MSARLANAVAIGCAVGAFALASLGWLLQRRWLGYGQPAIIILAAAMLIVGALWLQRRQSGSPFNELALPVAVATVMPLLMSSADSVPISLGVSLLTSVVAATLGVRLTDWLPVERRPLAVGFTVLVAGAATLLGVIRSPDRWDAPAVLGVVGLAAATALPGLIAAVFTRLQRARRAASQPVTSLELGVVGLTPAVAILAIFAFSPPGAPLVGTIWLVAWILVVLVVQYVAVGPLTESAAVATTQRDIVVAAMEAERSRIAADIHDDALQGLTLLGWRLDSQGQAEAAASVREIADGLRGILGDLRLPILDDLGAGPALEWLVERLSGLVGGQVRLERSDQVRPPADVELAFFRVAQEALSNAVRHGRPPIVVRYWTSPSGAWLSIDDAGGGFDPVHVESGLGHFGLLNMRQRAEQIGAMLDVRRWPGGGTRVALEWRGQLV